MDYYPGTLYQVGASPQDDDGRSALLGLRGIVVVDDTLWIANEAAEKVLVLNRTTGEIIHKFDVTSPVGLYYDDSSELVYVASNGQQYSSENPGGVQSFWKENYSLNGTFQAYNLVHPTSVARYENILYVAEQTTNTIMTFDLNTQLYVTDLIALPFK